MSRILFAVLGLVILQTIAAQNLVKQAEELLTKDPLRFRRDEQAVAVQQAELLLTSERFARSTNLGKVLQSRYESKKNFKRAARNPQRSVYSQPGAEPMQIKIMSLD